MWLGRTISRNHPSLYLKTCPTSNYARSRYIFGLYVCFALVYKLRLDEDFGGVVRTITYIITSEAANVCSIGRFARYSMYVHAI